MTRLQLNFSPNAGQWWFTLRGANGKILMTSEMYTTKRGAEKGMAAVKKLAAGGVL